MQIKKRYIREEIERIEKLIKVYEGISTSGAVYDSRISVALARIDTLEWVLGFADD